MTDNITVNIDATEPEIAVSLDELRYLVFRGLTGDSAYDEAVKLGFVGTEAEWIASLKGADGVSFVPAYLDEGVVRYANAYGEHDADDIYTATAMAQDIDNGVLPLVCYSPEDNVFDYFELDRYDISGATWVVYFRSKDYLLSVDSTGAYTLTDRPQGGSGAVESVNGQTGAVVLDAEDVGALPANTPIPAAVTEQTVAGWGFTKNTGTYSKPSGGIPDSDIASAATWNAKGTYSKPSTGIPASDLASGVIPSVPQMATAADMSDWTSGKTVDAALLKTGFQSASQALVQLSVDVSDLHYNKADKTELPDASATTPVMDGTAAVGTSTDYARADHVHPSDTTRLSTTGNAYRSASIPMGHLDATSTATVMTATVDGITELRDGVCVWLQNGVVTSASGFTLNVNNLGAKPCYSSLAAASRSTTIFNVNYTMLFVYNSTRVDGGCWDIVYGVDTNTTYTPPKLGFGYGTCTTAAATAAKTASISSYALTAGGIVSIHFDNDVPSGATLNITSKGAKAIYHKGAAITAGVIKAGDTATFVYSTYYHLISIDRDDVGDALPSVTASDNGKFLRVVNGAWAAASLPSAEGASF